MEDSELTLLSLSDSIRQAFESMMHSGRPDIDDEGKNSLLKDLYVDLFGEDYILKKATDSKHIILKGRRGTGKSTIFVRAEEILLKEKKGCLPIYINLQTCYEETPNKSDADSFSRLNTYKSFFQQVLNKIKEAIAVQIQEDSEFKILFDEIENGKYVDDDFRRDMEIATKRINVDETNLGAELSLKNLSLSAKNGETDTADVSIKYLAKEIKVYSIHNILTGIKSILKKYGIEEVYLFLDDFSELDKENQKVIVDALIAPIISSYNETYKVKIAAYPNRIYMGNIDSTKIPVVPLDFYEAFGITNLNYTGIEKESVAFIKRTLEKRISIYTNNQIELDEIFATSSTVPLDEYLKKLFEVTAAIPRCLGFILSYCYLPSINKGLAITMTNIDNAAEKYYEDNLYPEFINDVRFKQAFHDDKKILDQLSQKWLIDEIIRYLFDVKRGVIKKYQSHKLDNKLFLETIEENRKGQTYWIPTSHFYMDKDKEQLLNTLELYFLINKFNAGSKRNGEESKVYYYGLNYGLCIVKKIDYGRPKGRRSADYWRQDEFDLSDVVPSILSNIETIQCTSCGKQYTDIEYDIYVKYKNCFQCGNHDTVKKVNKFALKLESKIEEWKKKSLPDVSINTLRVLYNKQQEMSAFQIGQLIDQHHMSIFHATNRLKKDGYIEIIKREKRYYRITDKAISQFFMDDMEKLENMV